MNINKNYKKKCKNKRRKIKLILSKSTNRWRNIKEKLKNINHRMKNHKIIL